MGSRVANVCLQIALAVAAGCQPTQSADPADLHGAVRAFLTLDAELGRADQVDQAPAERKRRLKEVLQSVFAGPELQRRIETIDSFNLEGEGPMFSDIDFVGPPLVVEIGSSDGAKAVAEVEGDGERRFKLDLNLENVGDLFEEFQVVNLTRTDVESLLRRDEDSERFTFEVRTRKRITLELARSQDRWRITGLRAIEKASTLSIVEYTGPRRVVIAQ